jgi:hypothetical protein
METQMETLEDRDAKLVGTFRRFGDFGPPYQVMAVHGNEADIEFPESGEKISVLVEDVRRDPEDR